MSFMICVVHQMVRGGAILCILRFTTSVGGAHRPLALSDSHRPIALSDASEVYSEPVNGDIAYFHKRYRRRLLFACQAIFPKRVLQTRAVGIWSGARPG